MCSKLLYRLATISSSIFRFTCADEPELVTAGANVVRVFRMRPSERKATEAEANKMLREKTPPKVKILSLL